MTHQISMTWPQMRRGVCMLDGSEINLAPRMAEILSVLLMRRGCLVSYDDLIEAIYPDPDRAPEFERGTLSVHIWRLRQRLPGVIGNVNGRGFIIEQPAMLAEAA